MEKLVSVVVPVYNVKDYLYECIDSIKNQTYKNIEIILVDDGSTDGSSQICDELAKEDERIKLIHKENGGLSDARNVGLNYSNGEYIIFIDSDDLISKIMIEQMINSMLINDADISACTFKTFKNNNDINYVEKLKDEIVMSGKELVKKIYAGEYTDIAFTAWNKLYKKRLFQDFKIEYPVGRFYEDSFTTFKLLYNADKLVIIDNSLYFYRVRQGSIMNSVMTEKKIIDWIDGDKEAINYFTEMEESELLDLAINAFFKSEISLFKHIKKDDKNLKKYLFEEYKKMYRDLGSLNKIPIYKRFIYWLFMYMPDVVVTLYR